MSYGITDEGLIIKTLTEIQEEVDEDLKASLGDHINTLPQSVFGQLKGIFSEREANLWELVESLYNSQYPNTAFGIGLDYAVALTGVTRLPAQYSIISGQALFGTQHTLIPEGTEISKLNEPDTIFITTENVTLGAGVNARQTVSLGSMQLIPTRGSFKLTYRDEETDSLDHDSTASNWQDALNDLDELSGVVVSGDWINNFVIDFDGDDGLQPQVSIGITDITLQDELLRTVTPIVDVDTIVGEYQGTVDCIATLTGELTGDRKSITEIENPISGFTKTFNPNAVIAGRDEETDAELRIRRNNELQVSTKGTLDAIRANILLLNDDSTKATIESVIGFQNITSSIDARGLPANSFEMVVYEENGGATRNTEVAEAIQEAAPTGIENYGRSVSISVTDSQGFDRLIKFSRPTEVNIYCEIDLTIDSDFPADGSETIQDLIVDWGNDLGVGEDIIVYPQLISQLNTVQGITDVAIRIGRISIPTTDDNISIDNGESGIVEISRWSTDRLTITEL